MPVGTVQGVASGIQWQSMVDQIMQADTARELTPVANRQTALQAQSDGWNSFESVVTKFRDASAILRDPTSFDSFTASANKSATSSRDLVSATAATGASPGSYSVEVLSLAKAAKISGTVAIDSATALGVTGSFALNGRAISVIAGDSLASLRDKINAVNSGTTPSGVSATILSGANGARLVLTSDNTGASGIEAVDDGTGTLQTLGFADSTTHANLTATGATQTNKLPSATAAITTLLGVPLPAPTTMKVGGQAISVDFSIDSLSTIAAKINTATGNANAATVTTETVGGKTTYRLVTNATVEADSANAATSARALGVLGFTQSGRSGIAQVVQSANAFTDASGGTTATASTLLTNMQTNGQLVGISAGDTISIGGTKGDGTAVTRTFTVQAGSTVQDLLGAINDASTGFGAGTRTATASITNGRIAITDGTVGDSQLGISLAVNKASGGTVSLGAFTTGNGGTVGRSREITAGADSAIRVEGQMVQRSTNTVSDAISGVTLNLLAAEAGTTVSVQVARNTDAIAGNLTSFATAYNNLRNFITQNTAAGAPLAGNTAIRSMGATINSQLLQTVAGLSGTYTSVSLAGLQHDRNGVLSLDSTVFKTVLASNFNDIKALFATTGTATDSEVSYISAGAAAQPSAVGSPYAVAITQPATVASVSGAQWTTYATAGAADTMSLTDTSTGLTGSISLANGDTLSQAVQRLNSMFSAQKMRLTAQATTDNRLQITSSDFGTTGGFTVAYTPGTGGDGTGMLGITAQAYAGLDVAGTINGKAGTGKGQYLTGGAGDASESLIIRYTGTTARAAGAIAFALGAGGLVERNAIALAATNTGSVAVQAATAKTQADSLQTRINDIQRRLDARKATLTQQFIDMETAMSKAQAIGSQLTAQLNQLQQQTK